MEQLITSASDLLYKSFKVRPEQTRIKYVRHHSQNSDHFGAQGFFNPNGYEAHIQEGNTPVLLHEYHGHGTFFENTALGTKLAHQSSSPGQKKEAVPLDYRLLVESNAVWTEGFLLDGLDEKRQLERRLQEWQRMDFMKGQAQLGSWKDIYERIKQYEREIGKHDLWYRFGFPRVVDKSILIEIAKEKLGDRFDKLRFLFHFGSKDPGSDIDLCAILEDDCPTQPYQHGRQIIDLVEFQYSEWQRDLQRRALPATEPVMTGDCVYGDETQFLAIRKQLKEEAPALGTQTSLLERSRKCLSHVFQWSNPQLFIGVNSPSKGLAFTLNELAYALSCFDAWCQYRAGKKIVTLQELKQSDPALSKAINLRKNWEQEANLDYFGTIQDFVHHTERRLAESIQLTSPLTITI